jgi:hypothetical protein
MDNVLFFSSPYVHPNLFSMFISENQKTSNLDFVLGDDVPSNVWILQSAGRHSPEPCRDDRRDKRSSNINYETIQNLPMISRLVMSKSFTALGQTVNDRHDKFTVTFEANFAK